MKTLTLATNRVGSGSVVTLPVRITSPEVRIQVEDIDATGDDVTIEGRTSPDAPWLTMVVVTGGGTVRVPAYPEIRATWSNSGRWNIWALEQEASTAPFDIADISGLQAELDSKSNVGHTHAATDLVSGIIPDARFPATLPVASGANLTNLNASNLASGTVPDAQFPATLPAASGVNLTALNATNLGSGTVPTARLGSGTANSTTYLRGDQTWQTVTVPAGANPTGTAGLSAVNGSATTFMRSDGAPAVSQSITPTWTGLHTFSTSPTSPGGTNSERFGSGAVASGQNSAVFGRGSSSNQNNTIVIGANNTNTGSNSLVISFNGITNSGSGAFIIGNQSNTYSNCAMLGINSTVGASDAISMGRGTSATQNYAVALGHSVTAGGYRSLALGVSANVSHDYATCVGHPVTSRAAGDFCFGYAVAGGNAPTMRMIGGSSTTNDIEMFNVACVWVSSTHVSRTSRAVFNVFDTAAREAMRIEASGTAAKIGFLGASAVVRQTVSAAATDAATTQTLVNDIRTALIALGLCV